jgi:HK97 family phage major capsid protein
MSQTLAGLDGGLLPIEVVGPIIQKAQDTSVIAGLTTPVAVSWGTDNIPVQGTRPEMSVVGEAGAKTETGGTVSHTSLKRIKLAGYSVFSEEFVNADIEGLYTQMVSDLGKAFGRGVDYVIAKGASPATGTAISGATFIDQTTNVVELGSSTTAQGGIWKDFVNGYNLVVDQPDYSYDFEAFVADKRLKGSVLGAVDTFGRPLLTDGNLNGVQSTLLGVPAYYTNNVVSGTLAGRSDDLTRAYAGEFSSIRFGFASQLTMRISREASVHVGGTLVNLWETNQIAVLVEGIFGWVVPNPEAFAKYVTQTGS